tara:strand:- start:123 stop:254 length:132 start_codon:yes stop_codon:yes gene_type:complete
MVMKYGMKGILIMIGDWAVKTSKGKDDDIIWNETVRPFIEENF